MYLTWMSLKSKFFWMCPVYTHAGQGIVAIGGMPASADRRPPVRGPRRYPTAEAQTGNLRGEASWNVTLCCRSAEIYFFI